MYLLIFCFVDAIIEADSFPPLEIPQNSENLKSTSICKCVLEECKPNIGLLEKKIKKDALIAAFDKHLFYPTPIQYNKRGQPKQRAPSAILSDAWRNFYLQKNKEKKNQIVAKRQKKDERIRKKDGKENLEVIRRQKKKNKGRS